MLKQSTVTSLFLLVLLCACSGPQGPAGPAGPIGPSLAWDQVLSGYGRHIYLAGIKVVEDSRPDAYPPHLAEAGTAFRLSDGGFYTNAHVALVLHKLASLYLTYLDSSYTATLVLVPSGGSVFEDALALQSFVIHPAFDTTVNSADLARLYLATPPAAGSGLTLAGSDAYYNLQVGQEVATMGFPGETMQDNIYFPLATIKVGNISALRPFKYYMPYEPKYFIEYSMDLTGGTSGSPVFDKNGDIIAVHNSGYETGSLDYGIRVDLLMTLQHTTQTPVAFNRIDTARDAVKIVEGRSVGSLVLGGAPPVTAASGYARVSGSLYFYTDSLSYVIQAAAPGGQITALRLYEYDYDVFLPPFSTEGDVRVNEPAEQITNNYSPAGIVHDTLTVGDKLRQITRVNGAGISFFLRYDRQKIEEIFIHAPGTTLDFSQFSYEKDFVAKAVGTDGIRRIRIPGAFFREFLRE